MSATKTKGMKRLLGVVLVLGSTAAEARTLDDSTCAEASSKRALPTMRACAPQVEARATPTAAAKYWMALADAALDPSVEDRIGMDVRRDEAMRALGHASRLAPEDPAPLRHRARLADAAGDLRLLKEVASQLVKVAPHDPQAHAYMAILAIEDADWAAAEAALSRAGEHGLPPARVSLIQAEIDRRQPVWRRYRHAIAILPALALLLTALRRRRGRSDRKPT